MRVVDNQLLEKYLERANLNYSDLAKGTDIARSTIYNMADGRYCPSHSIMTILADFLEISPEDFLTIFFSNINFTKEFWNYELTRELK